MEITFMFLRSFLLVGNREGGLNGPDGCIGGFGLKEEQPKIRIDLT